MGKPRLVALVSLCSAVLGCSAIRVVRPPQPPPPPGERVSCTTSRALPWVDMVIATLSAAAFAAATTIDCQGSGCDLKSYAVVTPAALMIGYGVSALYGHDAVTECRELLKQRGESAR